MLRGKSKALFSYLATFASFYRIISMFRKGITYIKELDSALTEMRKVSDETVSSLQRFQDVSFDIAGSIGTTAVKIQNSAADFMRLGYSLKEASELAQDANIYANVGDMEIDEATEHMISSIKAWGSEFTSEVEASGAIVDRYNEIGNNFAITSADIGAAMERSAAALKAGGNTLNEALGLITAGNLVQQDAETTANALKVMSLRIRGSKTDLEEMGEETDGLASSTSKLREEIKALTGVDIMADENTYKSTAKIIQEIGAVWDNLTDVSKASALEKLAGKTRASVVAGLLENYKTIDEVIKSAENADGSATEENLRYMDSIEGKIQKLQNQAQEFWHNVIQSDTLKWIIDGLTDILTKVNKITESIHEFSIAIIGVGAIVAKNKISNFLNGNKNSGGRVKVFALIA
jgi:TP901 family phage tail tape measure protein